MPKTHFKIINLSELGENTVSRLIRPRLRILTGRGDGAGKGGGDHVPRDDGGFLRRVAPRA